MNQTFAAFDPSAPQPSSGVAEDVLDSLMRQGDDQSRIGSSVGRSFDPLRSALLQSRQRWRDMALMAGDLAFETDRDGRFVFLAPDPAFGWPVASLLGQDAATILAGSIDSQNINPFRPTTQVRARRAWLLRPDGGSVCFSFAAAPLLDEAGNIIGARGLGQDISEQDVHDASVATSLRRGEMLDHILWRMRQEVLAPRMMQVALESVTAGMGLEGAAVVDMSGDGVLPSVLHQTGTGMTGVLYKALSLLEDRLVEPAQASTADGHVVLVCPCQTRFGNQAGLALWRPVGGRSMDTDDVVLASSATGLVRVILEHEAIQREMARQARTDPLTGLLNRRAFFEEMARRLDRLERDNTPGTLLFIDLDNFKALNDCRGHDTGDEALVLTASILRSVVRAQDLVARLGGDEFAIWLDATDEFSAAERAEQLRLEGPKLLQHLAVDMAPPLTMSIGIATRWPGRGEDVDMLMQRADQVMYQVKRSGRGHWLVSRTEEPS
jgi:diguanylate cyclase (GGDEF)-like protein